MTRTKHLLTAFLLLTIAGGCESKTETAPSEVKEAEAKEPEVGRVRVENMASASATDEVRAVAPEHKANPKIHGEEFIYKAGDTELVGFLSWDESHEDKRPGILIVHEWWGHNRYVRKRANMLAELGYTALALDMYGDGKQADHPDDAKKFMMEVFNNADTAKARFEAAKSMLKDHPTTDRTKIAAIGYCFGGAVVLNMARAGADLAGVASFHGNLGTKTPAKPGAVKAKVLVLNGAADPFVPKDQIEAFEKEMKAAKVDYEIIHYNGAKHAFTNPEATENGKKFEIPLAYDRNADKESWTKMKDFLEKLFAS